VESHALTKLSAVSLVTITYHVRLSDLIITAVDAASDAVERPSLGKKITEALPIFASDMPTAIAHIKAGNAPLTVKRAQQTCTFIAVRNAKKNITQLMCVVTSLPPPPQELYASLEKHRDFFDALPLGICCCDSDGTIRYINLQATHLLGYHVGDNAENPTIPFAKAWQTIDGNHHYITAELPLTRALHDGKRHKALMFTGPFSDLNSQAILYAAYPLEKVLGQSNMVIGIIFDISTQWRAEFDAARHIIEVQTIMDNVNEGIAIYDRQGILVRANDVATDVAGWMQNTARTQSSIGPSSSIDILSPSGKPLSPEDMPLLRALNGEKTGDVAMWVSKPDGTRHIIAICAYPLHDPTTGEVIGAINMLRLGMMPQRGLTIQDEFMSIASHELRTPLTTLSLATQLITKRLQRENASDSVLRLVHDMSGAIQRMNIIISNMFEMSRITSGSFSITTYPINFASVVRSVIDEFRAISGRYIALYGVGSEIRGTADEQRLRQSLTNLLYNATQYTLDSQPITVSLRTTNVDHGMSNKRVSIEIRDKGPGMSAEHLARVLSNKRPHLVEERDAPGEGLGIGIFVARTIIEAHGGNLWISSHEDDGSVFTCDLPLTLNTNEHVYSVTLAPLDHDIDENESESRG
jgi:signal transduction histidine kinase